MGGTVRSLGRRVAPLVTASGMRSKAGIFLLLAPLVLWACAGNDTERDKVPAAPASAATATLVVGRLETGFLFFGNTRIRVASVDGRRSNGDEDRPVSLAPGAHTILVTAYRDPVSAYACLTATVAAGKTYVVRSTVPYMETTTMWLEDNATGGIVGEKTEAKMIRSPLMYGPALNKALFGSIPGNC